MAQTKEGAKKTTATNRAKYGADYYARIGAIGGKKSNPDAPKGFAYAAAHGLTWHKEAGRLGGKISKRTKK